MENYVRIDITKVNYKSSLMSVYPSTFSEKVMFFNIEQIYTALYEVHMYTFLVQ